MSFTILIQRNNSEKNKLIKDTTTLLTLTGTLKNETSIIDPVIIIEGSMSTIKTANYATISEFNRKYFITNIKSVRTNLLEISMHVDVLSTYSTQIKALTGIVKKQENAWNLYLNDGTFKVYQNSSVVTKSFPTGFTSQNFVLAVAGAKDGGVET